MPKSRTKALTATALLLFGIMSFLMLNGIDRAIAQTRAELDEQYSNRVKVTNNFSEIDKKQLTCLAKNVYFESRGESDKGMLAVAHVTINRAQHKHFPRSICGVVQQKNEGMCQFSWYCDGESDRIRDRLAWIRSMKIAFQALTGQSPDPTHGALYFHNFRIAEPEWSKRFRRTTTIGSHSFYRGN
jgi:spore germination cell wall hydrolase CwlJ-like protein